MALTRNMAFLVPSVLIFQAMWHFPTLKTNKALFFFHGRPNDCLSNPYLRLSADQSLSGAFLKVHCTTTPALKGTHRVTPRQKPIPPGILLLSVYAGRQSRENFISPLFFPCRHLSSSSHPSLSSYFPHPSAGSKKQQHLDHKQSICP